MSSRAILEQIKRAAAAEAAGRPYIRRGNISAYNPNDYTCRVIIQPEGVETGWIQLGAESVGNGWGLLFGPSIGDDVEVHFELGDLGNGSAASRFFNASASPPGPVASGEFWLVHQTGSLLKLTNDGNVALTSNVDLDVTVGGNLNATVSGKLVASIGQDADLTVQGALNANVSGNSTLTTPQLTLNGDLTVNGNAHVTGTVTGDTDVIAAGKSGKGHEHGSVQSGTATTSPPI